MGPSVAKVLEQGLAKDPDKRFPTCKAFAEALSAALFADGRTRFNPLRKALLAGHLLRGRAAKVDRRVMVAGVVALFVSGSIWLAYPAAVRAIETMRKTTGPVPLPVLGQKGEVESVALTGDAGLLALALREGGVRILQGPDWTPSATMEVRATSLAFSKDGSLLATGERKDIRLWKVAGGSPAGTLRGHTDWVTLLSFSLDGSRVVSASDDQTVRTWKIAGTAEESSKDATALAIAWAPDASGLGLAAAPAEGGLRWWNLADGRALQTVTAKGEIRSAAFSPDLKQIAAGFKDGTIRIWAVESGRDMQLLTGHNGPVTSLAFGSDRTGGLLASGSSDTTVRLWRVR